MISIPSLHDIDIIPIIIVSIKLVAKMNNTKKAVTMIDVAKDAGVGTMTVSRALREPSKVSPETRQAVMASVMKLGYVIDATAAALSSKRTRIVGAVVSTLDQSIFAETIRGLTNGLQASGQQLLVATTDYDKDKESELISAMIGRKPEAIVLTNSEHSESTISQIKAANILTIETWEIPRRPICAAVGFSNREAGQSITKHLLEAGREKIAFLGIDRHGDSRGRLRYQGYCDVIENKHQNLSELQSPNIGYLGPDYGASGLNMILKRWPNVDAIVCASDAIAFGVYCEANRKGIQVPTDLAITGFGDFDYARDSGVGLTTVRINGEKIGQITSELISESNNGVDISGRVVDLGFEVVRRLTS